MKLQDLLHLKDDARVRFKTENVNGKDVVIVCYMIADSDFWSLPLATECRGIVFDAETGDCICRPFEKFFNVGERTDTQRNVLDFTDCEIVEKRDGSMLCPVIIDGNIFWKTKKSFTSEVALSAQKTAESNDLLLKFVLYMIECGLTPIFEYTDPRHQIVIDYGETPSFTLLALRSIKIGNYLSHRSTQIMGQLYNIPTIAKFDITHDEMFDQMETLRDFEGYVVTLRDGRRVKQKTNWYLLNHRIMTSLRERDVAQAVIDETIDDIKSAVSAEGKDIAIIEEIEHRIVFEIEQIRLNSETLHEKIQSCVDRKAAALAYCKEANFSLAMKLYDGKEPDYAKIWATRHLKEVSLRCIYNSTFSGDE